MLFKGTHTNIKRCTHKIYTAAISIAYCEKHEARLLLISLFGPRGLWAALRGLGCIIVANILTITSLIGIVYIHTSSVIYM